MNTIQIDNEELMLIARYRFNDFISRCRARQLDYSTTDEYMDDFFCTYEALLDSLYRLKCDAVHL